MPHQQISLENQALNSHFLSGKKVIQMSAPEMLDENEEETRSVTARETKVHGDLSG